MQVITDETFGKHQGFDLASFDEKHIPPSDLPSFRVLKNEPFSRFKQRVADQFKYNLSDFKLWVMVNRQNKTIRPDVPVLDNDSGQSEHSRVYITRLKTNPTKPCHSYGPDQVDDDGSNSRLEALSRLQPRPKQVGACEYPQRCYEI